MAFLLSVLPEPNAPVQICMDGRTWLVCHQGLTAALQLQKDRKSRPNGRFLVSRVDWATSVMGQFLPAPATARSGRNGSSKRTVAEHTERGRRIDTGHPRIVLAPRVSTPTGHF